MHNSTEYSKFVKKVVTILVAMIMLLVMVAITFDASYAALGSRSIKDSDISASSAIVFSGSTSETVYSLHDNRKLPIGDVVKLMDAMVVLDNIRNDREFKNKVSISSRIDKLGKLYKKGQEVTVEQLLSDMLTKNSDEAAYALAVYSSGKRDIFVSEMNSKAMEIGLANTQYMNVTGKYDSNQYSSAYDTAVITQYALRYERIANLLAKNEKVSKVVGFVGAFKGDVSGKGKSDQAVVISDKKGMKLITVLLGTVDSTIEKDSQLLTRYGIDNVTRKRILKAGKKVGTAKVRHGSSTRVPGYLKTDVYVYVPPEGSDSLIQHRAVMREDLKAPITNGQKIGEYRVYVADELKGTVDIVARKDVKVGWLPSYLYISNLTVVLIVIIILFIVFLILRHSWKKRKKIKEKERRRQAKIEQLAREQQQIEEDRKRRNWTYTK